MAYRRFKLPEPSSRAATLATFATVEPSEPENVATVATVAGVEFRSANWDADFWIDFFNECAAIAEFDGGLARKEAEALAHSCCLEEWMNGNSVRTSPGQCPGCGESVSTREPLASFITETAGQVWLHRRCWDDWYANRALEANAALAAMGVQVEGGGT